MSVAERLDKAKERLDAYYKAELAVLAGQEYRIGRRSLTRADLSEIRKAIESLEGRVLELESAVAGKGKRKSVRIVPRDL